jgi:fluoroquinolone resistance protein
MDVLTLLAEGQIFKSNDFSKKSLKKRFFANCSFDHCNFSECLLQDVRFCSCIFIGCNLSLPKLEGCRFQDARFIDCKIVGVEFFKCDKTFFSACFENCLLHYCNFSDLNMKNALFRGSKLRENYFTNTCLNGADFSTATQYAIDPQTNKIKKARFSIPEVIGLLHGFDITIV